MITTHTKVAEVAAESLAAIRVFQKYGIDFCCGGQKPLGEVCESRNIPPAKLLDELSQALAGAPNDATDWSRAPLRELMNHIVERHHAYLRSELPRIQAWLDKVYSKYADKDPDSIGRLPAVFTALREELESHLQKEELILFPWIARYEESVASGRGPLALPFGRFENPMHCMEAEHEHAGEALRQIRALTHNYTPPEHACRTYRALFEALAELESDLHLHIHLENNILHPRAQKMAAEAEAAGVGR